MIRQFLLIVFLMSQFIAANEAQKVTISKDFNIRNDFGYEILGKVNDRILLYRDKHAIQEIEVFDRDLQHIYKRELTLEKKKATVHGINTFDTCFHLVYSYSTDSIYTMLRKYDDTGMATDTSTLFISPKNVKSDQYEYVASQDKNLGMLFHFNHKEGLHLRMIDHRKLEPYRPLHIEISDRKKYGLLKNATLSNDGVFYILFEKDNKKFNKEKHKFQLLAVNTISGEYEEETIPFHDWLTIDLQAAFDEKNQKFQVVGLFNEKQGQNSQGIFSFNRSFDGVEREDIAMTFFDATFLKELYKDRDKEKLEFHKIKDLRFSQDGGIILFTEFDKVFSRRTPFQGYGQNANFRTGTGWMDHYLEEVLIFAFSPEGDFRWKNLLLKKQFSQDDNGAFSSFFLFALPSRLMLIFNDDIRKNSLVSEFEVSPSGKLNRNSLLSTENQELKLRFTGAAQITNRSFIVPSEKSNKLRLVMVTYE